MRATHGRLLIWLVLHGDRCGPGLEHGAPVGGPLCPSSLSHRSSDEQSNDREHRERSDDDSNELCVSLAFIKADQSPRLTAPTDRPDPPMPPLLADPDSFAAVALVDVLATPDASVINPGAD